MLKTLYTVMSVESAPGDSETYTVPTAPQKAVAKNYHAVPLPTAPNVLELDTIKWGARLNDSTEEPQSTDSGYQTPKTPNDLERSRPATPTSHDREGVHTMQSFSNPPMNKFRMTSTSLLNFANGLSDSAPGALIPYIEK